jgi:ABC-type sugar transport system substrate-binding protein
MKKLKFLVSLTTNDNDYQIEQAAAAEEAARRLGADVKIIYAENDSITQSQQILSVIQSRSESHPDGIIFEPVGGTALPQVARAAVAAGISWVVLNRNVDYIAEIRKNHRVPIFGVSSDPLCCPRAERSCTFRDRPRAWPPKNAPPACMRPSRPMSR